MFFFKIPIFFLVIFLLNFSTFAKEPQHKLGLKFTDKHTYEDTDFMRLESKARKDPLSNIGLVYNYENYFKENTFFEFDSEFSKYDKVYYWSNSTGVSNEGTVELFDIRFLLGLDLSNGIRIKSGYGYREGDHDNPDKLTSTGHVHSSHRQQIYEYIPFILENDLAFSNLNGKLKFEYDWIINGENETRDDTFANDEGYGVRASYQFPFKEYLIEPYYNYLYVTKSTTSNNSLEPTNSTRDWGLKVTKILGPNNNKNIKSSAKNNNNFFIGLAALKTRTNTELTNISANGNLDDENWGQTFYLGYEANENVDFIMAYNNFGKAEFGGSGSGTITVSDKFRNGSYADGTSLSFDANTRATYRSNSFSLGLRPKFYLTDDLFLSADVGFEKWWQHESVKTVGSTSYAGCAAQVTTTCDYQGFDPYHGFGLGVKTENLDFFINRTTHDMHYELNVVQAGLRYKF